MGGSTSPGNHDLEAGRLGPLGKGTQPIRGAVRRHDQRLVGNAQRSQGFGGVTHGLPVGLATHDDGDGGCHAEIFEKGGKKRRGL